MCSRLAIRATGVFLLLVVLAGSGLGQKVTKIWMDTQAEGWGTGLSVSTFTTDTEYAYCRVEVEMSPQGAAPSYTLVLTWYAPDGKVYQTDKWELPRDPNYWYIYQRVGKLKIAGTRAAELIGKWRVVAKIQFEKGGKDVEFTIVPAPPRTPWIVPPASPPRAAQTPPPVGGSWPDLIAWAKPAVVFIQGDSGETDEEGNKIYVYGSGVIISSDGYILTAAHVVQDIVGKIEVLVEESKVYEAAVVKVHPKWDPKSEGFSADVALLKISASGLHWLSLGDSTALKPEEEVRVLGYPRAGLGLGLIPAGGKALGLRKTQDFVLLQIEVSPFDKGHSGGPVIDAQGRIVGIAIGTYTSKETGVVHQLAIATPTIREILPAHLIGEFLPNEVFVLN
jgi:S1-C subfamily serine protease